MSFTDDRGTAETLTSALVAASADISAPTFLFGTCTHEACTLNFSEFLDGDPDHAPLEAQFSLSVSDSEVALDSIAISGLSATLMIDSRHIGNGDGVTVEYDDTENVDQVRALQDAAGNDVADFDGMLVNNSPRTVPGKPKMLSATAAGRTGIDLSWTEPTDLGGYPDITYTVEESADGGSSWSVLAADHSGTAYSRTGLTAGSTRHYRVSAVNAVGAGTASRIRSATTWEPNRAPTGTPTIDGTAQVGETLTVNTSTIADPDGLDNATFDYQWIRNSSTDIAGATAPTYTPTATDMGATIKVRVGFTDDRGTAETLTSAATAAVAAVPPGEVVWSAVLTVERWIEGSSPLFGFSDDPTTNGALEPDQFTYDGQAVLRRQAPLHGAREQRRRPDVLCGRGTAVVAGFERPDAVPGREAVADRGSRVDS